MPKFFYFQQRLLGWRQSQLHIACCRLEGLGFRAIGRILKLSYGTVYQWVKEWGSKVELPKSENPVAVMELDEMHTYVGSKKLLLDMDCCW